MEKERSALEEDLDSLDDACADSFALFCGNDRSVAPCTLCEWAGICPQHNHKGNNDAPGN